MIDASDRSYLEIVLHLLERAKKEVVISLYLLEPQDTANPFFSVNRLLESLLKACARGVRIEMYLNSNFRFKPKTEVGQGMYFQKLIRSGVVLTTLLPHRRLHDKLIVVDNRYVVEGSMNWSVAALESNFESVSIIDSRLHAAKKLKRIEEFTKPSASERRKIDRPLYPVPQKIEFPLTLFEQNYLPEMVRESDWRSMDLYFVLLGQSQAQKTDLLELDLETVGRVLGLPINWDRTGIRRQILKVLRKLAERYRLIQVDFAYGQDARIQMKRFSGETIQVPGILFEPGTLVKESSGVTFLTLAGKILRREGIDIDSLSASKIEQRFGIGLGTIKRIRSQVSY